MKLTIFAAMDSKDLSRKEYINRIIRVMEYIDQHLDQAIDLSKMADIASFSPFHFHRIFTLMTGETPNTYVSRIRLEKVGRLLQSETKLSIATIAFDCGFENLSSFSRAFKKQFNISAKEFRQEAKGIFSKEGIRYSKNGNAVSKIGKNIQQIDAQFCSVELKQLILMDIKIEIKQMPALKLICYRRTGAFNQIGQAYEELFKWAAPRGLLNANTKALSMYHDDPSITEIAKMRNDACLVVDRDVDVEGEIRKSQTQEGKYAVGYFEIGIKDFEKAWNTMYAWLSESGYQPKESSPYEIYHNDNNQHPEKKFIVEICIPVKQL
ncbi:AraC family transcriptional regulator [Sphingobacterium nematocida]|uniref:AraC family transcriptional regulator n=1 Tax=Sphingobacterium nematocida TaxID=1513896 RepID=A0A1T5FL49_9SPHI|nr:AraC family transcriptional regulator [Sphingobacterium nematocida]SKB96816.1 AraC family transcriptional regulator [Sphingobacterium nematocida]